MAPDLNSLPPSPPPGTAGSPLHAPRMPLPAVSTSMSSAANTISSSTSDGAAARTLSAASPPVPHPSPPSLAAAAAMNAGMHSEESRRSSAGSVRRDAERARRRSSIRMNLNLNDPTVPSPGEMQRSPSLRSRQAAWPHSPHHERAPSLGELHQELENEQEAQVNRLLNMIRQQQAQILALTSGSTTTGTGATHAGNAHAHQPSSSAVDDSTPTSERSLSRTHSASASHQNIVALSTPAAASSAAAAAAARSRSPNAGRLSRHSSYRDASRGSSRAGSPMLRPISSSVENPEWTLGSTSRDESAFYQAETQMLTRENQMLKMRIRELERQLTELNTGSSSSHAPATASNLHSSSTPPAGDGAASGASAPSAAAE